MSIDRETSTENVAHWRRVLNKPEPTIADRKPTQAERLAAWSARHRSEERAASDGARQTRTSPTYSMRSLHAPGTAFRIGEERIASDGTLWRRTA